MYIIIIMTIIGSYLLGSIPFGLIITRYFKKDLRSIGSGNIGATNVSRALGRRWGYVCFVLDVLKGFVPMILAKILIGPRSLAYGWTFDQFLILWLIIGCVSICGHVFPIYIGFRGGKGVATSFGVALGLWPYFTLCAFISFIAWLIFLCIWRYISLASILASLTFVISLSVLTVLLSSWSFLSLWPLFIISGGMSLLVIIRHRSNISRLWYGIEVKINRKH